MQLTIADGLSPRAAIRAFEIQYWQTMLRQHGSVQKAATVAGMRRADVYRLLARLDIVNPRSWVQRQYLPRYSQESRREHRAMIT